MNNRFVQLWTATIIVSSQVFGSAAASSPLKEESGFLEIPSSLRKTCELFTAYINTVRVYCLPDGIGLTLPTTSSLIQAHHINLRFRTTPQSVLAEQQCLPIYRIVLRANCEYILRKFSSIRYCDIVPGVDIAYRIAGQQLKYDVLVEPYGNINKLEFVVSGARVTLGADGTLVFTGTEHHIVDAPPTAVQPLPDGSYRSVGVSYIVTSDSTFSFHLDAGYNPSLPVVIDPAIVWSTYAGGSLDDAFNDVATDAGGNVYVCGNTASLDFPLRGTTANRGNQNMIVAKFSPTGRHLWSTYFGGESNEVAKAIVCDNARGLLYVGGWSSSFSLVLDNPFPNRAGGAFDAVVLAFTTDGSFVRGTFLGGSREELVNALSLRTDGTLIAAGRTNSPNFPILQSVQPLHAGDYDVFIAALSVPTLQLVWSTYYGGASFDEAYSVATHPNGSVFIAGVTASSDFPVANGFQTVAPSRDNAFVVALTSSGQRWWATYLGGDDYDLANRVAYSRGSVYVVGTTSSRDFPIRGDSIAQRIKSGYNDAFIAALTESGQLQWSTFLGASSAESAFAVAISFAGDVLVAGTTSSPDFPRLRSILWDGRGGDDVFIALFRTGKIVWSTTFGGSGDDILNAAVLHPSGDIIAVGESRSRDFQPLVNPAYDFNSSISNVRDGFAFRLCTFTPSILGTKQIALCPGQSAELATSDSLPITSIRWNTGSTSNRIVVTAPGQYWFVATSESGCIAPSDTVKVTIASTAPVSIDTISPRRTLLLCQGEQVALVIRGRYQQKAWYNERDSLLTTNDTLWVTTSGSYYATVVDSLGCTQQSPRQRVNIVPPPILRYVCIAADGTTIPLQRDSIRRCSGDTITIEVERPSRSQCIWSDGSSLCRRVFTAPAQVRATVIDSNQCQWQMQMIDIAFEDRAHVQIVAPDTVCLGAIFTCTMTSTVQGHTQWDLPTGTRVESASDDSTQLSIVFSKPGIIVLRAWLTDRCSDTARVNVVVTSEPSVSIHASARELCLGDSILLTASPGFAEYVWNGVVGTHTITVRDSGWYVLEAQDTYGCTTLDSVYIALLPQLSAMPPFADAGTIPIGQSTQFTITLQNPTNRNAEYILSLARGQNFTIVTPTQVRGRLMPNEQLTMVIEFHPNQPGPHDDTLHIGMLQPCQQQIVIPLTGVGSQDGGTPNVYCEVGSIAASPHDDIVTIPVYLWSTESWQGRLIDSAVIEIWYNPTMLLFLGADTGLLDVFLQNPPQASYVRLRIPLDSISTIPTVVTHLRAAVLLGNRQEDSLVPYHLETRPAQAILPHFRAGVFHYTDLCRTGGVRLLEHSWTVPLSVAPNPNDGTMSIIATPPERGPAEICIYSALGKVVWKLQWIARAGSTYELTPPSFESGVYFVFLRTAHGEVLTAPFVVHR